MWGKNMVGAHHRLVRQAIAALAGAGLASSVCGMAAAQSEKITAPLEQQQARQPLTLMTEAQKREELQRILSRLEAPMRPSQGPTATDDLRTLWNGAGNRRDISAPTADNAARDNRNSARAIKSMKETLAPSAGTFAAPQPEDALGRLQRNQRILTQQRIDDIVIIESNR
jgi:hypothetical protein